MKLQNIDGNTSFGDEITSLLTTVLSQHFPNGIKSILFVVPPDAGENMVSFEKAKRTRYWNYPPYGFGTLASVLKNDMIQVKILNLNNAILRTCHTLEKKEDFDFSATLNEELNRAIQECSPDLIGITCMFSQTHPCAIDVCNKLKVLAPQLPLVLGGVHITNSFIGNATRDVLLEEFQHADYFFLYEAEIAFRDFVRVVNQNMPVTELAQVVVKSSDCFLHFAKEKRPTNEDLDIIPAYDLMDIPDLSKYGKVGVFYCLKDTGTRFATVLSNRGCRARCTFCSVRNFNGKAVRARSVQSVIDELKLLKNEYGVDHIMWLDDDLLYDYSRAMKLFNEMVRQNVGITWDCTNGVIAAAITKELALAAAESGCIGLFIAIESGNPQILKEIKKPGKVKQFLQAAEILRDIESINSRVYVILGFPGETYRMIMDTINVCVAMNLDWYGVSSLVPLPNTPIYDMSMADKDEKGKVDFAEIRYTQGSYGKLSTQSRDMLSKDFKNAFVGVDFDSVPTPAELENIWAYMNYHLNYERMFHEERPVKLIQQMKYLESILTFIVPNNAIVLYFYGYLSYKLNNHIDPSIIQRLESSLQENPYWQQRFNDFQLSPEHLKVMEFPDTKSARESGIQHLFSIPPGASEERILHNIGNLEEF